MQAESSKYLWDAARAADRVAEFVAGKTFDDYVGNAMLRSAVERQFEILGEALAQMAKRDAETAQAIPELRRIIAFRIVLIHGYATVDDKLVWGVVEGHLLGLRATLQKLLDQAGK
ncbi:MAG: DUF86 domain-containing protein [Bryobacteraceae bacterium]